MERIIFCSIFVSTKTNDMTFKHSTKQKIHHKRGYKYFIIENKKNTLTLQRAIYDRSREEY